MDEYMRQDQLIDMAAANDGIIHIDCASTFVFDIRYNMNTHICFIDIWYRGEVKQYFYPDMDFDFFVEFVNSESKGKFYNAKIKPKKYPTHSKHSETSFDI